MELNDLPTALKRSFENIIQNALTYGNKADIFIQKGNNELLYLKMMVQVYQKINTKTFLNL